ncbi:glucokinase [Thermodesulfobacteriota bacterium]
MSREYGLIADVGGTNIRLELVSQLDGERSELREYLCADFPTIVDAVQQFLRDNENPAVTHGCIAIASPADTDLIAMTNHTWQFSITETQAQLGWKALHVINDYTAIAMSLPHLGKKQKTQIGGGESLPGAPMAVFGPGTGLGVAHLINVDGLWVALSGEGGHVDFAPNDEVDLHILRYLSVRHEHVSVEQVLSGPGLVQIYQAIADLRGNAAPFNDPAEITTAAVEQRCTISFEAIEQFCRILGSFAGNLALTLGTFGGVFIAGGIVPRFVDLLRQSEFRNRFEAKGRFKDYNARIPTFVITEPQPGLAGAAAYLMQTLTGP